ncbi:Bifunctional phosphoribosylaminoimidazolecarboxamide formyltransferase/IMP cyclohydrolase [Candidatus Terasakiella magnetica]|uniref:ATP synthase protein I n=1 Tax=Candidatus Terasakiella magnetica TaxID=1867952 RepID=A0A1C3RJD9_9PROT|nr:AtpZ/AtpI family protein [Candidatus Terasakiella magnetica]SCA57371.1 Bifunctional phosphoribosylaminoimidazolecarboxamide formyltransferase/IMP cyclohydrolase [Candidatus Terasakiella magnetica]
MSKDDKDSPELDEFDTRLKQAQEHSVAPRGLKAATNEPPKGLGLALRCGADLISGLVVGVAIGYALDHYVFDTKPWLMVLFFFLGAAAGMMNVFRTVQGLGMAAGYKETFETDGKDDNLKD